MSSPEQGFRFTPIKALRAIPRLWDRTPSTPFQAGQKPRKLWKRIAGMAGLSTAPNDASNGICSTSNSTDVRGVKRMRIDSEDVAEQEESQGGFLETKWELQASTKRRKLPDETTHNCDEVSQGSTTEKSIDHVDVINIETSVTPQTILRSPGSPIFAGAADSLSSDAKEIDTKCSRPPAEDQSASIDNAPTPTKAVRTLTQKQEGTLVRSALRSSLDGVDAELLNDFLSKAQAKRAAKTVSITPHIDDDAKESPDVHDSQDTESDASQSRRVLEVLDANKSPTKSPSPAKGIKTGDGNNETVNAVINTVITTTPATEEALPTPTSRRSARARIPIDRNNIHLRRPTGSEFIFQQRTPEQEFALAIKRNTRKNRGAVWPKDVLMFMALPEGYKGPELPSTGEDRSVKPHLKTVSWNEVEIEEHIKWRIQMDLQKSFEEDDDLAAEDSGANADVDTDYVSPSAAGKARAKRSMDAIRAAGTSRSKAGNKRRGMGSTGVSGTPMKKRPTRPLASMAPATTAKIEAAEVTAEFAGPSVSNLAESATSAPVTPKTRRKLTPKSPVISKPPSALSRSGIPTRTSAGSGSSSGSSMSSSTECMTSSSGSGTEDLKPHGTKTTRSNAGSTPRRVKRSRV